MENKIITSPAKAIRAYCLSCIGSSHEVKLCPIEDCALWPFRFGRNPYTKKRELTDEQKAAAAARLAAIRAKREAEKDK